MKHLRTNTEDEGLALHPGIALRATEWNIGADDSCAIRINASAGRVAQLVQRGPRLFVQNLGTREEVFVNGERLRRRAERELTIHADLNVAGTAIVLDSRRFTGAAPLAIETSPLRFVQRVGASERVLCEGLFLCAQPGTFTAILGPVGCGKTVFLSLLNGDLQPASGRITMANPTERHSQLDEVGSAIAYLPQEDGLLAELTVRQSLDCRLRLRFPDMAARVRRELIHDACRQVGVPRTNLDAFLDANIGGAKPGERGLSGGERKRAAIAHELLLKPSILILDEPTSGLSSLDAEKVIRLLRDLATQPRMTVLATLHQPSASAFACFSDLLMIAPSGRMAYYGPASTAQEYLEQASETPCVPGTNPAEFILGLLEQRGEADRLAEFYLAHPLVAPLTTEVETNSPRSSGQPSSCGNLRGWFVARFVTLFRRQLSVLRADQPNLWLAFGQVPVIAMVMFLAFAGFQHDAANTEALVRKVFQFTAAKEDYQRKGQPVPVERLLNQADSPSAADGKISVPAARRRGAVYFILVAASFWFGILGGCREVVAERHVLHRERRIGLHLGAYLAAKMSALAGVSGLQTGLLTVCIAPVLLDQSAAATLGTWSILWLVSLAAAALGLLVSCLAPTLRFALTAVPLLMIPPMILGGLLRPEADLRDQGIAPRVLSWLTPQRWGFEAALQMDQYAQGGVVMQEFNPDADSRYGALDWIRFRAGSLPQCFFAPKSRVVAVAQPAACLVLMGGMFLAVAHWQLSRSLTQQKSMKR